MNAFLFLDVDGVLNSEKWERQREDALRGVAADILKGGDGTSYQDILDLDYNCRKIDPKAIEVLNTVIEKSGAVIVITSVWRTIHPLPVIVDTFERRGFKYPLSVIGCTHELKNEVRGVEIQAWLSQFETDLQFAILDDSNDMDELMPHLVQTDCATGLGPEHVEPLLKLLSWSF